MPRDWLGLNGRLPPGSRPDNSTATLRPGLVVWAASSGDAETGAGHEPAVPARLARQPVRATLDALQLLRIVTRATNTDYGY